VDLGGFLVRYGDEVVRRRAAPFDHSADEDEFHQFDLLSGSARRGAGAPPWITKVEFAGTGGWTLTEAGSAEHVRQLADELV